MLRIAVDGTASAGKGALARGVAAALRLSYVDTGAMYRTVGLFGMRAKLVSAEGLVAPQSQSISGLAEIARSLTFDFVYDEQQANPWRVFVDGEDVTLHLRSQEVGSAASFVSSIPEVRKALFDCQRRLAGQHSVIMDGRDIGTVIMPQAELKVFVDAQVTIRAERRYLELRRKGKSLTLSQVKERLVERDHRDRTRAVAPLLQAEDARLLDTSDLSIEEGIQRVVGWVREMEQA